MKIDIIRIDVTLFIRKEYEVSLQLDLMGLPWSIWLVLFL